MELYPRATVRGFGAVKHPAILDICCKATRKLFFRYAEKIAFALLHKEFLNGILKSLRDDYPKTADARGARETLRRHPTGYPRRGRW